MSDPRHHDLRREVERLQCALDAATADLQFYDQAVAELLSMVGTLEGLDPLTNPEALMDTLARVCDSEFALLLRHEAEDRFSVIACTGGDRGFAAGDRLRSARLSNVVERRRADREPACVTYCEGLGGEDGDLPDRGVARISAVAYFYGDYRCLVMCNRRRPIADDGGPNQQYYRTPEGAFLRIVISLFPL
ncbi:MAG: hypothetical protein FJX75_18200 [Armatimonadetes bacterium]|nr:hypothetical protein [Armatimonadota bacterium]